MTEGRHKKGGRKGLEKAVTYFSLHFGPESTPQKSKEKGEQEKHNSYQEQRKLLTGQRLNNSLIISINRWERFR
jgi:hypothetical protein